MAGEYDVSFDELKERIDKLLLNTNSVDLAIKNSINRNIDDLRTWLPKTTEGYNATKNRLHIPAMRALVSAQAILNAIEQITNAKKFQQPSSTGSKTFASQIFSGAHILIKDGGALADANNVNKRFSSHYRDQKIASFIANPANIKKYKTQAELEKAAVADFNQGKPDSSIRADLVFNELVIGKVTIKGEEYTWLQFEGHSHQPRSAYKNALVQLLDNMLQAINYSIEKFLHHVDYVKYCFHGKKLNIGQYGNSEFTESNPLILNPTSSM